SAALLLWLWCRDAPALVVRRQDVTQPGHWRGLCRSLKLFGLLLRHCLPETVEFVLDFLAEAVHLAADLGHLALERLVFLGNITGEFIKPLLIASDHRVPEFLFGHRREGDTEGSLAALRARLVSARCSEHEDEQNDASAHDRADGVLSKDQQYPRQDMGQKRLGVSRV